MDSSQPYTWGLLFELVCGFGAFCSQEVGVQIGIFICMVDGVDETKLNEVQTLFGDCDMMYVVSSLLRDVKPWCVGISASDPSTRSMCSPLPAPYSDAEMSAPRDPGLNGQMTPGALFAG